MTNPAARKRIEEAFEEHMKRIAILRSVPSKEQLFTAGYLACAREAVHFLGHKSADGPFVVDAVKELAEHLGVDGEKP